MERRRLNEEEMLGLYNIIDSMELFKNDKDLAHTVYVKMVELEKIKEIYDIGVSYVKTRASLIYREIQKQKEQHHKKEIMEGAYQYIQKINNGEHIPEELVCKDLVLNLVKLIEVPEHHIDIPSVIALYNGDIMKNEFIVSQNKRFNKECSEKFVELKMKKLKRLLRHSKKAITIARELGWDI